MQSGQLYWKVQAGEAVTAPPVFAQGLVCVQAAGLLALDLATGKVMWRAGLGGALQAVPVITGGPIYIASLDGEVYALE
jgi:outer membrane protein assembly factor BamB